MTRYLVLFVVLSLAASAAQANRFECRGQAPDWSLSMSDAIATLSFLRETTFDIPQRSQAEGRDWPRAMTLIAEFDTAILVVDQAPCDFQGAAHDYRAHVLTQRGQTPILLTGCCEAKP